MIKARRTSTNYVYDVEINGWTSDLVIKVTRCTARSNIYGLFSRSTGEQVSAQEFKSALAAAKAGAAIIGEAVA